MPSLEQLTIGLIVVGGFFAFINWIGGIAACCTGRSYSAIPLLGGMLIISGMCLSPTLRPWAWIGVLADPGTLPVVFVIPFLLSQAWAMSRFNLLEEYVGQGKGKTVRICLFRNGSFTMRQEFEGIPGQPGPVSAGFVSDWRLEAGRLLVVMDGKDAVLELMADAQPQTLCVVVDFRSAQPANSPTYLDYSLAGIKLTLASRREPGVLTRKAG